MKNKFSKRFKAVNREHWLLLVVFLVIFGMLLPFLIYILPFISSLNALYLIFALYVSPLVLVVIALIISNVATRLAKKKYPFESLAQEMQVSYSEGGPQYLWPAITWEYNEKKKYMETIWMNIKDKSYMPKSGKITFCSISANKGKYENKLASLMLEDSRYEHINFILSDIAPPEDRVHDRYHEKLSLKYEPQSDANKIKDYAAEHNLSINIIWDFKGYIWYTQRDKGNLLDAFKKLYDVLEPGGLLIMDAYQMNHLKQHFNQLLFRTIRHSYGYPEFSTYANIKTWIDKNEERLKNMFDIYREVGKGNYQVAVFQKKINKFGV